MADLITLDQLKARLGRTLSSVEAGQASALISDASALALSIAGGAAWDATAGTVPPAVVPVVTRMVRRGLENPNGYASESLGGYTYRHGSGDSSPSGLFATGEEARLIRRAAGVNPVHSVSIVDPDAP